MAGQRAALVTFHGQHSILHAHQIKNFKQQRIIRHQLKRVQIIPATAQ